MKRKTPDTSKTVTIIFNQYFPSEDYSDEDPKYLKRRIGIRFECFIGVDYENDGNLLETVILTALSENGFKLNPSTNIKMIDITRDTPCRIYLDKFISLAYVQKQVSDVTIKIQITPRLWKKIPHDEDTEEIKLQEAKTCFNKF